MLVNIIEKISNICTPNRSRISEAIKSLVQKDTRMIFQELSINTLYKKIQKSAEFQLTT